MYLHYVIINFNYFIEKEFKSLLEYFLLRRHL